MEEDLLPAMIHFTIRNYFPEIWTAHRGDEVAKDSKSAAARDMYMDWFKEVGQTYG